MSAREMHKQALLARENGDLQKSLELIQDSLLEYQEENDVIGFAEAIADQTITLRLLYQKTNFKNYLLLAKNLLNASIEIAKTTNQDNALAIPLFNLGKVNVELKDYPAAISSYQQAIKFQQETPNKRHDRPAVLADFKIHLANAEYKNGDTSAKDRLLEALKQLEESDEDDFNKKVWLSGGHLYLAEMLKDTAFEEAKSYLQQAKKIIDSDQRLILRKQQWENLAKEFKE